MEFNFKKLEKITSKGNFIRVYDKKINVSLEAFKKTTDKFEIYLDRENKAILIKPSNSENSRSVVRCKSSNTITVFTGMPNGRYFYEKEYDGGFIFTSK